MQTQVLHSYSKVVSFIKKESKFATRTHKSVVNKQTVASSSLQKQQGTNLFIINSSSVHLVHSKQIVKRSVIRTAMKHHIQIFSKILETVKVVRSPDFSIAQRTRLVIIGKALITSDPCTQQTFCSLLEPSIFLVRKFWEIV